MTQSLGGIDHVAVTVADLERACAFFTFVFDAQVVRLLEFHGAVIGKQIRIGGSMLSVHQEGHGHPLVARCPTPGAVDICFRWEAPIARAVRHLEERGIAIIEGPVRREGSTGLPGYSVYFRDPDGNLIELLSTVLEETSEGEGPPSSPVG